MDGIFLFMNQSGDSFAEVSEGPEGAFGGGGLAFEGAGSIFAFGAEAVFGGGKGFVDELPAADDRAVGEVADAAAQHVGDAEVFEGGFVVLAF